MADSSLPSPPFIFVDGLPNFRDIGGYPVSAGKVVRSGIVFRASEPSKLTDAGIATLRELRVTDVYDLRSKQELAKDAKSGHGRQPKEWEGSRRIFAPVFLDQDYSPEAIALRFRNYAGNSSEGFVQAYQDILFSASSADNAAQPYRNILKHLATSSGETPVPVLLHCSAGKDRTGVICALVLSLCGVEDEIVAHEYSLTDLGLKSRHGEFVAHLIKEPELKGDPLGARRMVGSRRENMIATLDKIREKWGSVENAVLELKLLNKEEIEQLRNNLIVDGSPLDWEAHEQLVVTAQKESDAEAEKIVAEAQAQ